MKADAYCQSCGHVGRPFIESAGNAGVAMLLLLFFIVPGLIYLAWWSSKNPRDLCWRCRAPVIPLDSPVAIAALKGRVIPIQPDPGPGI